MAINISPEKGVFLEQYKQSSFVRPLMRLHPPEVVAVPLTGFGESKMIPIPRVSESIAKNSMLARSKSGASWVIAPVSGKLVCIERVEHPLLGNVLCAFLKVRDNVPALECYGHDPNAMSGDGIIQTAKVACITDETDGMPLYYKLQKARAEKALLIVADGIDDSPYITSALKTISEYGTDVCDGLGMVMKVLGGGLPVLAVYDPGGLNMDTITGGFGFTDIITVTGGYPAWYRFEREHCADRKFIRVGVQALRALSDAVRKGVPQVESIITVSGDCVGNPANIIVPTGVSVDYILEQVGLVRSPNYVIMGDTMTGVTCRQTDVPVVAGVRGICAMSELPTVEKRTGCVSCGRCTEVCPRRLFPSQSVRLYESGRKKEAVEFGAKSCAGCGACSAVCPCGIEVTDIMLELREME